MTFQGFFVLEIRKNLDFTVLYYLGRFYRMLFTVKFFSGITQSPEKSVTKFSLLSRLRKAELYYFFFVSVYIPVSMLPSAVNIIPLK